MIGAKPLAARPVAAHARVPVAAAAAGLTVLSSVHGHLAAAPSLTQDHALPVDSAVHAHLAEAPDLTQAHVLGVGGALHAHLAEQADAVTFTLTPTAVEFDGTNDWLTRGSDLTAMADGKTGLLSVWVKPSVLTGSDRVLITNSTGRCDVVVGPAGRVIIQMWSSTPTRAFHVRTSEGAIVLDVWQHIAASWNAATATIEIYVDGVQQSLEDVVSRQDLTIDYTAANWGVGASTAGARRFWGCMSNLYFTDEFLDLTDADNLARLRTAAQTPEDLGSDGSEVTGTQPRVYLRRDAAGFGINDGSGGDFTVTGTLEDCATTPFAPTLAVGDTLHGHLAGIASLTEAAQLAVAGALHAHLSGEVPLTQAHAVTVEDAAHGHVATAVSLEIAGVLGVDGSLHAHLAGAPSLTQAHVLAVQGSQHDHLTGAVSLTQSVVLVTADAVHAHLAGAATLSAAQLLEVLNAVHAHLGEAAALTEHAVLVVSGALHAHLAQQIAFGVSGVEVVSDHVMIVRNPSRIMIVMR